jgi:hypothetical protein
VLALKYRQGFLMNSVTDYLYLNEEELGKSKIFITIVEQELYLQGLIFKEI